jgi:DNA polymerase-3 subunit beta
MLLINTQREALLSPLQSVSGIVDRKHTLPILSNVLIEKSGDTLTWLATDIEMQIRTQASGVGGAEDAAVTVGARKLQDILRSLPEGASVSVLLEDRKLTLKSGRSRFNLQTLPAQDYPRMKQAEGDSVRLKLAQKTLKRLLSQVQFSMAQQDIRYYLNGLLLVASDSDLKAVATDGHRLAFASTALEHSVNRVDAILPRKTVLELSRLLADTDDEIEIELSGNQVMFRFGSVELISKLIDGKFPDFERVIPKGHTKLLTLPRIKLLQALQRAAILSNEKLRSVRFLLSTGSLKIVSANAEQEEAEEDIELGYDGEPLEIGFNVTYLLDVLMNLADENVECHLHDGNSSALITLPGNDRFRYVVMPMRI